MKPDSKVERVPPLLPDFFLYLSVDFEVFRKFRDPVIRLTGVDPHCKVRMLRATSAVMTMASTGQPVSHLQQAKNLVTGLF